jgi:hypothetical protein
MGYLELCGEDRVFLHNCIVPKAKSVFGRKTKQTISRSKMQRGNLQGKNTILTLESMIAPALWDLGRTQTQNLETQILNKNSDFQVDSGKAGIAAIAD